MAEVVGVIAGQGRLPVVEAMGLRAAGFSVVGVGLSGQYDAALPGLCDQFAEGGIIRLGRWVRGVGRGGARRAVMVGRVSKARMYQPWRVVRQLPDWRAAVLWYRVLRHDRRNAALLTAVADELLRCGVELIDTTTYIPEHLALPGAMTRRGPTAAQAADVAFALPVVRRLIELDIGQALAVKDREVIAVEAIEGTDALIERAGRLCRHGGWTLVKVAGPRKDRRFDVPTVGEQTVAKLKAAGAACLAVEAGGVILVDRAQVIAAADAAGIAVVGEPVAW